MAQKRGPAGKYAWTVTVGEKGQFVIPKQARELFGIKPGDTLLLLGDIEKGLAIPPKSAFAKLAAGIFGADESAKASPEPDVEASPEPDVEASPEPDAEDTKC